MLDPNRFDLRSPERMRALSHLVLQTFRRYHRAEVTGLGRIPDGPALYVGNHSGGLLSIDTFLAFAEVVLGRGVEHAPYALTHSVIVRLPGINQVIVPLGAVEASRQNADRLLAAGHKVLVYPGGDIETFRPFRQRHRVKFGGRRGWIRLAIRQGVPVVPVATAGAHATFLVIDDMPWLARMLGLHDLLRTDVWPLIFSLPWGLTVGPCPPYIPFPAKILTEFLDPITFNRSGPAAASDDAYVDTCAYRVEAAIQRAVDRMAGRVL